MNKTTDTNLWGIDASKPVAEGIEETTRGFVLKRRAQELKGHPFADFMAHLLNTMGYRIRTQFDSRYKGLLPLRWVYVPEAIESDEESQDVLTRPRLTNRCTGRQFRYAPLPPVCFVIRRRMVREVTALRGYGF